MNKIAYIFLINIFSISLFGNPIYKKDISLIGGISTGIISRTFIGSDEIKRDFSYSSILFGAGYKIWQNENNSISLSYLIESINTDQSILSHQYHINYAFILLGGARYSKFKNERYVVTFEQSSEISLNISAVSNNYSLSSAKNSFDNITGSVISFNLGLQAGINVFDNSRLSFGISKLVKGFMNSTEKLTVQKTDVILSYIF